MLRPNWGFSCFLRATFVTYSFMLNHQTEIRNFDPKLVSELCAAVEATGNLLLELRHQDIHPKTKADGSVVSDADLRANEMLMKALRMLLPGEAIISEEESPIEPAGEVPPVAWYVDPLDGSRPYVQGQSQFGVFVGYQQHSHSQFGILCFPALKRTYLGISGSGAWMNSVPLPLFQDASHLPFGLIERDADLNDHSRDTQFYLSRNLAYLDVCHGVLGGARGSYQGWLELWDISAMLAVLNACNVPVRNLDGSSIKVEGRRLITTGLAVGSY